MTIASNRAEGKDSKPSGDERADSEIASLARFTGEDAGRQVGGASISELRAAPHPPAGTFSP